jgi:hypothetical protein
MIRFTVDPWDPAYGAASPGEAPSSEAPVVVDIECAAADWQPRRPPPTTPVPDAFVFVDGVRRLEARTWLDEGDDLATAGIFASYAAGAVRCDGRAQIVDVAVGRGVYSPSATVADVGTDVGVFTAHRTDDAQPESLMYAVHNDMTEAEVRVAENARRRGDELLLLDGPLRKRAHVPDAVGLVKSHHVHYLPPALDRVVGALDAGERTPVFRVDAQPFSRYSWYVRLPGPRGGPWASILRCEATGALPARDVVALADRVTASLGPFASEPHKDPRAPQNLYPIAGLERELRRRMGDARIIYRALRRASSDIRQEAAAGIEPA